MALNSKDAATFIDSHREDLQDEGRLGKVRRYLEGDHDKPYIPRGASAEFEATAKKAVDNWLPLVSDTFTKGLHVDGYRTPKSSDNAPAWQDWQANGLDARQSIVTRGAIEHGASYALVLQGKPSPLIRPMSPLKSAAWFLDDDDDFPEVGLRYRGQSLAGAKLYELYDATTVYNVAKPTDGDYVISKTFEHGMGRTPFVRFRSRLDGPSVGLIRPLIRDQNRVNDVVFHLMMALQYASHRQRWATGMTFPIDEETGEATSPLAPAVDRLWTAEDDTVKFGEFSQTETSGHLAMYLATVRTLAAHAQISPNIMTGDLINLSADALAQMEQSTQRKLGELETLFGESWEMVFRLAAYAKTDRAGANDVTSQVRWRDTEARSLAATVDALGKLAQSLQVPVEALWELIPGVTDTDVARWRAMRQQSDVLGSLVTEVQRQTAATTVPIPAA